MNIIENAINQLQGIKNPFIRLQLYLKWMNDYNIKQPKKLRKI